MPPRKSAAVGSRCVSRPSCSAPPWPRRAGPAPRPRRLPSVSRSTSRPPATTLAPSPTAAALPAGPPPASAASAVLPRPPGTRSSTSTRSPWRAPSRSRSTRPRSSWDASARTWNSCSRPFLAGPVAQHPRVRGGAPAQPLCPRERGAGLRDAGLGQLRRRARLPLLVALAAVARRAVLRSIAAARRRDQRLGGTDEANAQAYWGGAFDAGGQGVLPGGFTLGAGLGLGFVELASVVAVFPRLLTWQLGWSF